MSLFPKTIRSWTAVVAILSLCVLDIAPAFAGLSPSQTSGANTISSTRDADMLMAQRALEHKVVAQKLQDYGMTPADAQAKLATMSDHDLHTLASASKGLPSGGGGATGAIIGVLVVVILVIVILRLTNHQVVVR